MMKKSVKEYHPNGIIKHKIIYHDNGCKYIEDFYDENGKCHRENLPDYQHWVDNGLLYRKTYMIHGKYHNINNSADIRFLPNGKIWWKTYCLNDIWLTKLLWQNLIKNI